MGALQLLLLPRRVIVFNDDFGYLRSILETVQHHRPWTDDWLEPWSASLSAVCAALWKLTGSFKAAVYGVQAGSVAIGFAGAAFAVLNRGRRWIAAIAIAGLLYTLPSLLWKDCEFTAFFLYTACLCWAVCFAVRNNWVAFMLVTCVAIASRQSAVAWVAVPAAALLLQRARERSDPRLMVMPLLAVVLPALFYLLCARTMNRTHAQAVMTTAMWRSIRIASVLQMFALAGFVGYAFAGLGNLATRLIGASPAQTSWRRGLAARLAVSVIVVGGFALFRERFEIGLEHGLFSNGVGRAYLYLMSALAVVGWLVAPFEVDWRLAAGALAGAAITSLRGAVWDYYFVDVAVFALFSAVCAQPAAITRSAEAEGVDWTAWAKRAAAVALAALLLTFHAAFARMTARTLDNYEALDVIAERALRAGKIGATDLSFTPFGFAGWHLYPYFVNHDGAQGDYIANFLNYLDEGSVTVQTRGAGDPRPLEHPEEVVATGVFTIATAGPNEFILRRHPQPPTARLKLHDYKLARFPLNDAEWQEALGK